MVTAEAVKATVDAYIEATNALDVERYAKLFAEGAVRHSPTGLLNGRDAIRQSAQHTFGGFTAANIAIDRLFVVGACGAYSYTGWLTAKNGRTGTIHGIEVLELNEAGEIEVARFYFDLAELRPLLS